MKLTCPVLLEEGPMARMSPKGKPVVVLVKSRDNEKGRILAVINTSRKAQKANLAKLEDFLGEPAATWLHAEVARNAPAQVEVWEGDVSAMHLGLSGGEWKSLLRDVTSIWHLAAASRLDSASDVSRRVNIEGTRNILELARAAVRPPRLHHFSSAFVAGDRRGVIMEDELMVGQRFRTPYEQSKARAEELVRRAMGDVPTTIYRPAIVVGDSRTGEIDRFEGPYYLAILLVTSPLAVPLKDLRVHGKI